MPRRVEMHVHLPTGDPPQDLRQVGVVVVENRVGAETAALLEVAGTGGGEYSGSGA